VSLPSGDAFIGRHIGPARNDVERMLSFLGVESLEALVDQTLPGSIRMDGTLELPDALME
jgi:glycine dehydrogenase